MRIEELILEAKKPKKKKIIYVDNDDPLQPYPELTVSSLEREIKKAAKDLEVDVKNPIKMVNTVFQDNAVPLPEAYMAKRFAQYLQLLKVAVAALGSARGFRADWSTT